MPEPAAPLSPRALVALAVAVLAPLLSALDVHPPGRLLLALLFFLLVPGVAIAELLRLPSELASWGVAVGTSLGLNILVAQAGLVLHFWHPLAGTVLLAVLSVALLVLARRMRPRDHARDHGRDEERAS